MALEKVIEYFKQYNLENRVLILEESTATIELAAKALNIEGQRVAKSLTFKTEEKIIMIITAGDTKIDNAKYRHFFNCKAKMLTFDEVNEFIGHEVGGVCPFAINEGVEVYLDESLKRFETVFPACGSSNSAIELNIDELYKYSNAISWIDVCKLI